MTEKEPLLPTDGKVQDKRALMTKLVVLVNISLVLWTGVNMLTKDNFNQDPPSASITFLENTLLNSAMQALGSYVLILLTDKKVAKMPQDAIKPSILRTVCITFSMYCAGIPQKIIPLSVYQAVLCFIPFFGGILQYFWLHIPVTFSQILTFVVAFSGILVVKVASPESEEDTALTPSSTTMTLGIVFSLLTAVGFAIANVATKKMMDVNYKVIQFH